MMKLFSLGIMTGTSCDGADLALCDYDSRLNEKLIAKSSHPYPAKLRLKMREAQKGKLAFPEVSLLSIEYSNWLSQLINSLMKAKPGAKKNCILSIHGQTVWHSPPKNAIGYSIQLIEPTVISYKTGCTVITGFRQPDLARGGQGAPLVPLYHWLLGQSKTMSSSLPFAIQNIGGIGNLTVVTKDRNDVFAFDTGPGNALIDMCVEKFSKGKKRFDRDGTIARSQLHSIDWERIGKLSKHAYFRQKPPKSTGRELFNEGFLKLIPGNGETKIANATALTAFTMAKAYQDFVLPKVKLNSIFIAGGGSNNPVLMSLFKKCLRELTGKQINVQSFPEQVAPPQFIEAMAFARLGVESILGRPISLAKVTGASENSTGAGIFAGSNYFSILKSVSNLIK